MSSLFWITTQNGTILCYRVNTATKEMSQGGTNTNHLQEAQMERRRTGNTFQQGQQKHEAHVSKNTKHTRTLLHPMQRNAHRTKARIRTISWLIGKRPYWFRMPFKLSNKCSSLSIPQANDAVKGALCSPSRQSMFTKRTFRGSRKKVPKRTNRGNIPSIH